MELDKQKRVTVPQVLMREILEPIPENRILKVFFSEKTHTVIFTAKAKKGGFVFIDQVHLDQKNRLTLGSRLYDLIPRLLSTDSFENAYMCLNTQRELCIKKFP